MRDNDGRKLDHKTLEALRIRAVDQVGEGAHPEDVAAALGLHRKTVYAWLAKYREGGKDALKAQPVPGRPPKLGGAQLSRLYALIAGQDPRQMQFEFALWTREMVREVIRREFRVSLSVVSVGRLLRKLGMSPQRPLHRAYQQDPEAVERWKKETYPAIHAEAAAWPGFGLPAAQALTCGLWHRDRAPGDSPARRFTVIPRIRGLLALDNTRI